MMRNRKRPSSAATRGAAGLSHSPRPARQAISSLSIRPCVTPTTSLSGRVRPAASWPTGCRNPGVPRSRAGGRGQRPTLLDQAPDRLRPDVLRRTRQLEVPDRGRARPWRAAELLAARQGRRRVELHQCAGLLPRAAERLRRLAGRRQPRLGLERRGALVSVAPNGARAARQFPAMVHSTWRM